MVFILQYFLILQYLFGCIYLETLVKHQLYQQHLHLYLRRSRHQLMRLVTVKQNVKHKYLEFKLRGNSDNIFMSTNHLEKTYYIYRDCRKVLKKTLFLKIMIKIAN